MVPCAPPDLQSSATPCRCDETLQRADAAAAGPEDAEDAADEALAAELRETIVEARQQARRAAAARLAEAEAALAAEAWAAAVVACDAGLRDRAACDDPALAGRCGASRTDNECAAPAEGA